MSKLVPVLALFFDRAKCEICIDPMFNTCLGSWERFQGPTASSAKSGCEMTSVYGVHSFVHLHPPQQWTDPSPWQTWTALGRCHLLHTMVSSNTSGLCFPVFWLSHCLWPKLSFSILNFLQMVRPTGRCLWAGGHTLSHEWRIFSPSFTTGAANTGWVLDLSLCATHTWLCKPAIIRQCCRTSAH